MALPEAADAAPLLERARAVKTAQEVERIRLAAEIAARAFEHTAAHLHARLTEAEAAALWQGWAVGHGTGLHDRVEVADGFARVASGPSIGPLTVTRGDPVREREPTLFDAAASADGYWCSLAKCLVPGELDARYAELEACLVPVLEDAVDALRPGTGLGELDRRIRDGIVAAGLPDGPPHVVCHGIGASPVEPPFAHPAAGGAVEAGMVLALRPGAYLPGGGGLRFGDAYLVTESGAEKLSHFPDGVVRCG